MFSLADPVPCSGDSKPVATTITFDARARSADPGSKNKWRCNHPVRQTRLSISTLDTSSTSPIPRLRADPFPYYRALLATPPIIAQRQIPWAIVSRYDDVVKVLRDHQGYSSVNPLLPGTEVYDAFQGVPVMTFVDEPVHARLRRVAAPSLAVRRMENMAPAFLGLVDDILDEHWEGKREIDAVRFLSQEVPTRVFGHLLGIPKSDNETIRIIGIGRANDGRILLLRSQVHASRAPTSSATWSGCARDRPAART